MSELKAYIGPVPDEKSLADYYLKSEVDKVFRRLKARLARKGISNQQLEADKNHNWSKYCTAMTELRHSNHNRCLAMAKWCKGEADAAFLRYNWDSGRYDDVDFYEKWHERWLALAEEPTWAKFLQLIHKEAK